MFDKTAYPLTFEERFIKQEYSDVVENNHAAPISLYCSNCGHLLGYPPVVSEVCPGCNAAIDLSKLRLKEGDFLWPM